MKKITITVTFEQWGHGYVNVIPTDYKEWDPITSGSRDYNLDPNAYTFTYLTFTGGGGSIIITDDTGAVLGRSTLAKGMDKGNFRLTI